MAPDDCWASSWTPPAGTWAHEEDDIYKAHGKPFGDEPCYRLWQQIDAIRPREEGYDVACGPK